MNGNIRMLVLRIKQDRWFGVKLCDQIGRTPLTLLAVGWDGFPVGSYHKLANDTCGLSSLVLVVKISRFEAGGGEHLRSAGRMGSV